MSGTKSRAYVVSGPGEVLVDETVPERPSKIGSPKPMKVVVHYAR